MNQIWSADTRQMHVTAEAQLIRMLSESESAKLVRRHQGDRRQEFILSRILMRMALSRHYDRPLEHWCFSESDHAAPTLLNPTGPLLNICLSHSNGRILVALSDQPVGVDIEYIDARRPIPDIARRVFTPKQQAQLQQLEAKAAQRIFFELWTRKEALVKALAGTDSHFQMISTRDWPEQGFLFANAHLEQYCLALAGKYPAREFSQFKAQAFSNIERCALL